MARTGGPATRTQLRAERHIAGLFNRIAVNPIRYAAGAVLLGLLIGGTTFSFVEDGASVPDGIWWAFVSMSTVGYGDIAPKTTGIRLLASFVIATGIAGTAILTAALAGRVAEARLADAGLTLDLDDDFDDLAHRLQQLKDRYVLDERYDDMLAERAALVVSAFRDPGCGEDRRRRVVEELAKCLDEHPEHAGAPGGTP